MLARNCNEPHKLFTRSFGPNARNGNECANVPRKEQRRTWLRISGTCSCPTARRSWSRPRRGARRWLATSACSNGPARARSQRRTSTSTRKGPRPAAGRTRAARTGLRAPQPARGSRATSCWPRRQLG
ncbi:unnamed protein product [Prorocentrum cordatum]|uniref:Uncharacterized protein n=1 Tax=Prorocentrum cordatum TaxID=2364126 RepID=A0ABN9TFX1_9DINO|nr:unnamed protein product [Polarella glacialis]